MSVLLKELALAEQANKPGDDVQVLWTQSGREGGGGGGREKKSVIP